MKKLIYVTAATLLVAGLAVSPALAQAAAKKPAKAHHTASCYDYAWDSQAQKDCMAGKSSKPVAKKASAKKAVKKTDAPKKS
jgi:hypothetical protein